MRRKRWNFSFGGSEVVWAGEADHLDVLGHFDDEATGHADWMTSGSGFDRARFGALVDAIFDGMMRATTKG